MYAGEELAEAASQALGTKMQFESISEVQAKKILSSDQGAEVDEAEKEYLLEYYSLVREGKTNYVSTVAFQRIFGHRGQEITEFFKVYEDSFKPKKRRLAKTKTASKSSKPSKSSSTTDAAARETHSREAKTGANSKLADTFDEQKGDELDDLIMAPEVESGNA